MCKKESKRGKIKNERVQDDYLKKISNHIEVESIDEGMIFNKSKLQLLRKENFKVVNRENESKYLIKET